MVRVIQGTRSLTVPLTASVVTLGTFDGVHRGHQRLLERTVEVARAQGHTSVVYTFDPHPAKVLAPQFAPKTLISVPERIRLMAAMGIENVVVEPFDTTFAELTADDWVENNLVARLKPKHVIVGFNFSYGKGRGGDPEHLRRRGQTLGFTVETIEPVTVETIVCSSTRVREFLLEGNIEGARMLLGRPFGITGVVIEGDKRGRTIGFPTANLAPEAELMPASGVYATHVFLEDDAFNAVTNIGIRPTFAGSKLSIESYLFDFSGDLYGKKLRVELVARIREEKRFDGPQSLIAQIELDSREAKRILGEKR